MNIGGDPGQDDYGLPPVDIEIPDDARELDRDVQAYHRELRSQRRRLLARRVYAPITRDGMVLPLLACCLALTLLAGTLLTIFTAGPGPSAPGQNTAQIRQNTAQSLGNAEPARNAARLGPRAVGARAVRPPAGTRHAEPAGLLPDVVVLVNGRREPLRALGGGPLLLALVPPTCRCGVAVRQLVAQGHQGHATVYLVGTNSARVTSLAAGAGLGPARVVQDAAKALPPSYRPDKLTAVLVAADGSVARVVRNRGRGFRLAADLRALTRGQ